MKNVDGIRDHVQNRNSVPDEQLRQSAGRPPARDVGYGIAFNAITLDVKDGVVTLGGTVHDYPSKDSAVRHPRRRRLGAKDVVDDIEKWRPPPMFTTRPAAREAVPGDLRRPHPAALRGGPAEADPHRGRERPRYALRRS